MQDYAKGANSRIKILPVEKDPNHKNGEPYVEHAGIIEESGVGASGADYGHWLKTHSEELALYDASFNEVEERRRELMAQGSTQEEAQKVIPAPRMDDFLKPR